MEFEEVLKKRRSVRHFQDRQVRREDLLKIVSEARLAPSWANAQEYRVYIAEKDTVRMIRSEFMEASKQNVGLSDYSFTQRDSWSERERRVMKTFEKEIGEYVGDDYGEFIEAQDSLFHAPCIAYLTLPNNASTWSKSDLGAFEMMLLLCAANQGIDSIVAQAFVKFPEIIRRHLPITKEEDIVIGIGLGYAAEEDKLNGFRSPRKPLTSVLTLKE